MKTKSIMKYQAVIVTLMLCVFVQIVQAETGMKSTPPVVAKERSFYPKQFGYLLLGAGGMGVDKAFEPYASITLGYQYYRFLGELEISGSRMLPYGAESRNWMPITTGNIGYNFLQIENWQLGILGKFGVLYQTYYSLENAKVIEKNRSDFTYGIGVRGEYRFNNRLGIQLESGYMHLPLYCWDAVQSQKDHRKGGMYVSIGLSCILSNW